MSFAQSPEVAELKERASLLASVPSTSNGLPIVFWTLDVIKASKFITQIALHDAKKRLKSSPIKRVIKNLSPTDQS